MFNPVVELGILLKGNSKKDELLLNIEEIDVSDFEVLDFIEESNGNESGIVR